MSENEELYEDIRVMVVDDSVLIRKYVTHIIEGIEGFELVGIAPNGKIGIQKLPFLKPDVVILDVEMPVMTGLEFLKALDEEVEMERKPFVIMFSTLTGDDTSVTFEALEKGASDFMRKPEGNVRDNLDILTKEFEIKIKELMLHGRRTKKSKTATENRKVAEKKKIETRMHSAPIGTLKTLEAENLSKTPYGLDLARELSKFRNCYPKAVMIGSSTGGPNAIRKIFEKLGPLPVPMVIAQHMPPGFTAEFAKNLSNIYHREVRELKEGDVLRKGVIYICPGGMHSKLDVSSTGSVVYKSDKNEYEGFFFKPSVDILFESAYRAFSRDLLCIVLSGMGKDGSRECTKLRQLGVLTLVQDEDSSVVWGMPGSTAKLGGADAIIPLYEMSEAINEIIGHWA